MAPVSFPATIDARRRSTPRWHHPIDRSPAGPELEDCNRKTVRGRAPGSPAALPCRTPASARELLSADGPLGSWASSATAWPSSPCRPVAFVSCKEAESCCDPVAPHAPRHPPRVRNCLRELRCALPRRGRRKSGSDSQCCLGTYGQTSPANEDVHFHRGPGPARDSRIRTRTPPRREKSASRPALLRSRTIHAGPWKESRKVRMPRRSRILRGSVRSDQACTGGTSRVPRRMLPNRMDSRFRVRPESWQSEPSPRRCRMTNGEGRPCRAVARLGCTPVQLARGHQPARCLRGRPLSAVGVVLECLREDVAALLELRTLLKLPNDFAGLTGVAFNDSPKPF